jgi:cell division septation protein DedD
MKRTDLKENSSVLFIGRGFIIIAIFITSSLSFTLGYFVGKSVRPPVVNQTSAITQQNSTEQKNPVMYEKGAVNQQPEQIQEHRETQQTVEIPKTQEIQQTQETQSSKETKETKETKGTKETKETKETPKPRKYTVQACAFKNVSDANILKARLDKKGYKTYITLETKNHKKLYKVRIGDFATRKEAEILSIKIKKSEGLNTFVTFKTEREGLR